MKPNHDSLLVSPKVKAFGITVCTVEEAAEELQMTIAEVRKIEAQALRKLRRELFIRGLGFDDLSMARVKR